MAIISSTAIGAGRKTAGELTYRRTRGRTIASRRITENKSNTRLQKQQRNAFGSLAAIAKSLTPWIELTFPKTRYGSPRNNFVKNNPHLMQRIKQQADQIEEYYTPIGYLAEALEGLKTYGSPAVGGIGNASLNYTITQTTEGLTYNLTSSRKIETGDTIRILIALSYITEEFDEQFFETVNIFEYTVTPEKRENMTDPYRITITADEIPQLADLAGLLPPQLHPFPHGNRRINRARRK
ncbi:MAG: hypothetical protein LIP06_14135 [Tannerellaceae bacterium]|nr:hypothetical protein [Tannerellaceae bacterium]